MDQVKIIGDKSEDWGREQIEVAPERLRKEELDDPRIIREFMFSFNPETVSKIRQKQIEAPTRQGLFNAHLKQIEIMLWGDGLVFDTEFQPRIVIGKKKYKIVIVCKQRQGVMLGMANKPITLTEALTNKLDS